MADGGDEDCGMRVDAEGADNTMRQQQHVAHVRLVDGDDHLRLQLRILNDRKTLFRPTTEKLDKIRYRLQILATNAAAEADATCSNSSNRKASVGQSLSRKAKSAAAKKKKKKTAGRPAEPQHPTMKVKVRFFDECGQEFLSRSLVIGDVLMHTARIEIGDVQYVVLRNQPLVLQLNVVDPVLAGIPIVPFPETEFCHPDECRWTWFRINEQQEAKVQCCTARRYIPTKADIGSRFRIECHAPSMHSVYAEDSKTEVVTSAVIEGPHREVFRKRQLLGETRAQNAHHGDAFRVMSYNILFDGYTTTDHAQQNLFPYAKPSVMNEMYRMQLVFQEIEECNADIICLQEMGEAAYNSFFVPMMKPVGYHTFYSGKTGSTHEGCAVFVRNDCFDVLQEHTIDLSMTVKHSPDPAIKALLAEFPEIAKGFDKIPSVAQLLLLRSRRDPTKHLIVSNTHLFYREDADLIRLLQAVALVREVSKIRVDLGGHVALVLCGDFNAFPDTVTVRFLLDARADSTHRHWQEAPFFKWNRTLAKAGNENSKEHPKNHRVRHGCFEHQLQLVSGCGIPEFTNFAGTFVGTLDYILVGAECLDAKQVFPFFTTEEVSEEVALPSSEFPSDHVSLICDLVWKA
uniref:Endonuclease/exonuclease/phosphatase domain-containing protein n=1 Tax=Globisporangium ultimum (strain ATCC 200006 / CBS 805.95 / DAOM BR144) TaxID=431595 RepID=K3X645_GLOUD